MNDFHFSLMKVRRGYLLYVPAPLHHSRIYLQVNQRAEIQSDEHVYQFFLFDTGNEFTRYQRFAFTGILRVGRDTQNNISISNPLLSKYQFSCDHKTREIQIFSSMPLVALNGEIIRDKACFEDGDVLSFLSYRFVFLPGGIMVNEDRDTNVSLPVIPHLLEERKLIIPEEKIPFFDMHPSLHDTFYVKLKDFQKTGYQSDTRPVLLTIGPSLMMSSASLATGLLSSYQAYMNGRDIMSYVPMLILPGVMFLSALLWNPLTRLYEKKKSKKIREQDLKKYESYLNDIRKQMKAFKDTYTEEAVRQYPPVSLLMRQIIQSSRQNRRENRLEIFLGTKKDVLSYTIDNTHAEDDNVQKMIDANLMLSEKEESMPWIIDCNIYTHIALSYCGKQMSFLQQILLQIIYYYDLSFIIYSDAETIEENIWLREIPNVYFHNGRMITQKWDDVMHWKERLKEADCLLISFYRSIPSSYTGKWIQLLKEDTFVSSDLLIHAQMNHASDYLKNQESFFAWEDSLQVNYPLFLYLLRNKKTRLIKNKNDFFSIHHIDNLKDVDIAERWNMHAGAESLEAYIGIDEQGRRIALDLNEKKDGPHGLIAGMTGSGKSEMIISLLLSLAFCYSYEDVQFALIDFKGGGGTEILNTLPHVASKLTNLDTSNMRRALISFHNECVFREICIHKMNMIADAPIMNLASYRKYWKKEYGLPHLSDLVIVVDEFAELKRQQPDFMNDLISVSRIGRSLGIHLILCTQKPTGVINEEIWSNCSFKICLKVQDKQDSVQMIRTDEAMYLKQPGSFYMLSDNGLKKGKAAYANETRNYSDTEVEVLDAAGEVKASSRDYLSKEDAEVNQIIAKIRQCAKDTSIRPLWLEPLGELDCEKMTGDIFAFVDDFYQRRYLNLHLYSSRKRNSLFVSCDYDEKEKCLYTILYACMNDTKEDDEIYIVDTMHKQFDEILVPYRNFVSLIQADDHEKWNNLVQHFHRKTANRKLLIIRDISGFYESELPYLHDLLEHSMEYDLYIIIFASNASSVRYKDLSFIQRRFTLFDENLQDVQQVLECSEKIIQNKNGFGLLKREHVLEFRFFKVTARQLKAKAEAHALQFGTEKAYQIPFMMKYADRKQHHGDLIPIGIFFDTYEWLTLDPCERMFVVSLYKEEWVDYYHVMKIYCKCSTLQEDHEDAQLVFLSLEEYRMKYADQYPVLYIGSSFSKQYTFYSKFKSVKEGEGIYFNNYESKRVKVL